MGVRLHALRRRERDALQQTVDTLLQRVGLADLDQRAQPCHRRRITLGRAPFGPDPLHRRPAAQPLDHLLQLRCLQAGCFPLGFVELQTVREAAQRVRRCQLK